MITNADRLSGQVLDRSTVPAVKGREFRVNEELAQKIRSIIIGNQASAGASIRILQEAQKVIGYLPVTVLEFISVEIKVPITKLYGIASFYSFFNLSPKGEHTIQVCLGTACFVRGGQKIMDTLKRDFNLLPDTMTEDGKFSLQTVRCLGACGLSPVIAIDGEIFGRMRVNKLKDLLNKYK